MISLNSTNTLISNLFYFISTNFINDYLNTYIYDLLFNCICENGCPLCVRELENNTLIVEKNNLFKWISVFNNNSQKVSTYIKKRSIKIEKDNILRLAVEWKSALSRVFFENYGLEITNVAEIIIESNLGKGILGQYNPIKNEIKIKENIGKEKDLVMVLAHELTHNWLNEKMNNKFKDKQDSQNLYYVEGFVQWLSFKVLAFYGIIDEMQDIKLRGIHVPSESSEYCLGFLLFNEIEKLYGFFNAFNVMIHGHVINMNDVKVESDQLLQDILGIASAFQFWRQRYLN